MSIVINFTNKKIEVNITKCYDVIHIGKLCIFDILFCYETLVLGLQHISELSFPGHVASASPIANRPVSPRST